ncbi:sigma-70 family RNA polymerase sigma factor [Candidatus Hydrogenedentota bacterium]
MTDADLIENILDGDEGLFGRVVERYAGYVWAVCSNYISNRTDCEDVVQEVFLRCYRHLDTLRRGSAFGPWLNRLARNESLRWLKKRSREKTALSEFDETVQNGDSVTLDEDLGREELRLNVRAMLDSLPENLRIALTLCYAEGYTAAEAAQFLGISQSALRKRLERGRRLLKEKSWDELEPFIRRKKHDDNLANGVIAGIPFGQAAWLGEAGGGASLVSHAAATGSVMIMWKKLIMALGAVVLVILLSTILVNEPPETMSRENTSGEETVASGSLTKEKKPIAEDREAPSPATSHDNMAAHDETIVTAELSDPSGGPAEEDLSYATDPDSGIRAESPPIEPEKLFSISGHILVDGVGIAGAQVVASETDFLRPEARIAAETSSNYVGAYTISGLSQGQYWLQASHTSGAGPKRGAGLKVRLSTGDVVDQDIDIVAGTCGVEGYVTHMDAVVPGAEMKLWQESDVRLFLETTSDFRGYYAFDNLTPGEANLEATARTPGAGIERHAFEMVTLIEGGWEKRDLTFSPVGGKIEGFVRVNGSQAADVLMRIRSARRGAYGATPMTTRTDETGYYRFEGLAPESQSIRCGLPQPSGGVTLVGTELMVEEGKTVRHDIDFRDGGVVTGRVYAKSAPRAGAYVSASPKDRTDTSWKFDGIRHASISNSTGEYIIAGLTPGRYHVSTWVSVDKKSRETHEIVQVSNDTVRVDLHVDGLPTGEVHGIVANQDGDPLSRIKVTLMDGGRGGPRFSQDATTGEDGYYAFEDVPAGTRYLSLSLPVEGYARSSWAIQGCAVEVEANEISRQDFTLDIGAGSIYGSFTWDGGPPPKGINYRITGHMMPDGSTLYAALDWHYYCFEALEPGEYKIQFYPGDFRVITRYVDLAEGQHARLDVDYNRGSAVLTGKIVLPPDFTDDQHLKVMVFKPGSCNYFEGKPIPPTLGENAIAKRQIHTSSAFIFERLPEGVFDVVAVILKGGQCLHATTVPAALVPGETTEVAIDMTEQ